MARVGRVGRTPFCLQSITVRGKRRAEPNEFEIESFESLVRANQRGRIFWRDFVRRIQESYFLYSVLLICRIEPLFEFGNKCRISVQFYRAAYGVQEPGINTLIFP